MKKTLLIVIATASVVIATAAGVYFWDAIVLGLMAALLWVKKILTIKGLLVIFKKLPLLLLLGVKRLAIRVTSHFLMFTAHARFHQLQNLLDYLRRRAQTVKTRLKYHWNELTALEQVLATVAAMPLVLILIILMLVFVVPKAMYAFMGGKIKEHSGAAVLRKVADLGIKERLNTAEKKIKEKIRQKISADKKQLLEKIERDSDG